MQENIKDRIVGLKRVRAGDLIADPRNWRKHPETQAAALRQMVERLGWTGAVTARETEKGLVLVDGHLRSDLDVDAMIPVLVLDLTEEEAAESLATHDPIAAMAEVDVDALSALMSSIDIPAGAMVDHLAETISIAQGLQEDLENIVPSDKDGTVLDPTIKTVSVKCSHLDYEPVKEAITAAVKDYDVTIS